MKQVASRSQQKQDQRKIGNLVLVVCAFASLYLLSLLKTYCCSESQPVDFQIRSASNRKMMIAAFRDSLHRAEKKNDDDYEEDERVSDDKNVKNLPQPICDFSGARSDTCDVEGDIRIHLPSATVFFRRSPPLDTHKQRQWRIKPYAGKNSVAMDKVKEWFLKPSTPTLLLPRCTTNHSTTVVVFSGGGYTGMMFHDFTDVLVPLFVSSHQFTRDVHLMVADVQPSFLNKYSHILNELSRHHLITLDASRKEEEVHCFPRAIVGPAFHGELAVDRDLTPGGYGIAEFRKLLGKALMLRRENATAVEGSSSPPRLLIVSRNDSRVVLNQREVEEMAGGLGYEVVVGDPKAGELGDFARKVNSADVLLGVLGSGLTSMLFLPNGAVVVVVVPFGPLKWLAWHNYGEPAAAMGLSYMEHRVKVRESSLSREYPPDSEVLRNPEALNRRGWDEMEAVYLKKQNVTLDLDRLKQTLVQTLQLLPRKGMSGEQHHQGGSVEGDAGSGLPSPAPVG